MPGAKLNVIVCLAWFWHRVRAGLAVKLTLISGSIDTVTGAVDRMNPLSVVT